jgi:probable RNA-binding protein EIF1AD
MSSRKSRLAPSKHHLQTSSEPPAQLSPSQHIARIVKPHGNALYTVSSASGSELLVELPMRFRNAVWVRRGGYVLVDTEGYGEGKVGGEIVEVVRDEKTWRKLNYWCDVICKTDCRPAEFNKKESDEEETERDAEEKEEVDNVNDSQIIEA